MVVLAAGTEIAGHRIEALLGRGGMGVVYEARQLSLDRLIALKVIAPELVEDPDIRARFLEEARAAASFEHPNVIPVYTAGEEGETAYIAMRLVRGRDLRTLVRREGPLPPERAAQVAAQAASALDAIHAAGFVHRDVKPGNLLVDATGHIYLTDFGLVKQLLTHSGVSRTGSWVGTLDYVSPEQIRGGRIDARADVYALGGVLHYMLTAHVPFEREGEEAKLWAQLREPPPVPSARRAGLPEELDAVVARAMAKDPEARYPSAGDLGRAAVAGAAGASPSQPERMVARGAAAPDDAPVEPGIAAEARTRGAPAPPRRRRRAPLLAAAGGIAAAAIVAAFLLSQGGNGAKNAAVAGTPTPAPPSPTATMTFTPTPTATPRQHVLMNTIDHVGSRPDHVAIADGYAWVIGSPSDKVTAISLATGRKRAVHPVVGQYPTDIVADGDSVWAAATLGNQVVRIDARSGKVTRTIPVQGPSHLAAGPSGLWVGTRSPAPGAVVHFTRDGARRLASIPLPYGAGPIALTRNGVWVDGRTANKLQRLDPKTGQANLTVPGQVNASDLQYAGGYLWATQSLEDSVERIRPRDGRLQFQSVGKNPSEVAVIGDRVFITSYGDSTLRVLNRRTLKPMHSPMSVPFNPYGIAGHGHDVWVTSMGDDSLTRVRLR